MCVVRNTLAGLSVVATDIQMSNSRWLGLALSVDLRR